MRDVECTDVASYQCHLYHQSFFVRGEEHANGLRGSARLPVVGSRRAIDGWAVLVHGLGEDLHEQQSAHVVQVLVGRVLRKQPPHHW